MAENHSKEHVRRRTNLIEHYRSKIEESLVTLICDEHNLRNPDHQRAVKAQLEQLAETVPADEASGFNPDGFNPDASIIDDLSIAEDQTNDSGTSTESTFKAYSPSSTAPSSTVFDSCNEGCTTNLLAIFPDLLPRDADYVTRRFNGDLNRAIEFLFEYQDSNNKPFTVLKACDIWMQDQDTPKNKKQQRKSQIHGVIDKDVMDRDVNFIVGLTIETYPTVTEAYRREGTLAATLISLADQYLQQGIEPQDEKVLSCAKDLAKQFPRINSRLVPIIVHITKEELLPSGAQELCSVMNRDLANPTVKKLQIAYNLRPSEVTEAIETLESAQPKKKSWIKSEYSALPDTVDRDIASIQNNIKFLIDKKRMAIASLHMANRLGRSHRCYNGASVIYMDRIRECNDLLRSEYSQIASSRVEATALTNMIDLHGITVNNAPCLALQHVNRWWQREKELRAVRNNEKLDFTIITGKGLHSDKGIARIRRPVIETLREAGWEVVEEAGVVRVTGRTQGR